MAQGAVRCPIAFEWRAVYGEGDILKRSDTAAVTWLLNLFPGAGSQSRPNSGGQTAIVAHRRERVSRPKTARGNPGNIPERRASRDANK